LQLQVLSEHCYSDFEHKPDTNEFTLIVEHGYNLSFALINYTPTSMTEFGYILDDITHMNDKKGQIIADPDSLDENGVANITYAGSVYGNYALTLPTRTDTWATFNLTGDVYTSGDYYLNYDRIYAVSANKVNVGRGSYTLTLSTVDIFGINYHTYVADENGTHVLVDGRYVEYDEEDADHATLQKYSEQASVGTYETVFIDNVEHNVWNIDYTANTAFDVLTVYYRNENDVVIKATPYTNPTDFEDRDIFMKYDIAEVNIIDKFTVNTEITESDYTHILMNNYLYIDASFATVFTVEYYFVLSSANSGYAIKQLIVEEYDSENDEWLEIGVGQITEDGIEENGAVRLTNYVQDENGTLVCVDGEYEPYNPSNPAHANKRLYTEVAQEQFCFSTDYTVLGDVLAGTQYRLTFVVNDGHYTYLYNKDNRDLDVIDPLHMYHDMTLGFDAEGEYVWQDDRDNPANSGYVEYDPTNEDHEGVDRYSYNTASTTMVCDANKFYTFYFIESVNVNLYMAPTYLSGLTTINIYEKDSDGNYVKDKEDIDNDGDFDEYIVLATPYGKDGPEPALFFSQTTIDPNQAIVSYDKVNGTWVCKNVSYNTSDTSNRIVTPIQKGVTTKLKAYYQEGFIFNGFFENGIKIGNYSTKYYLYDKNTGKWSEVDEETEDTIPGYYYMDYVFNDDAVVQVKYILANSKEETFVVDGHGSVNIGYYATSSDDDFAIIENQIISGTNTFIETEIFGEYHNQIFIDRGNEVLLTEDGTNKTYQYIIVELNPGKYSSKVSAQGYYVDNNGHPVYYIDYSGNRYYSYTNNSTGKVEYYSYIDADENPHYITVESDSTLKDENGNVVTESVIQYITDIYFIDGTNYCYYKLDQNYYVKINIVFSSETWLYYSITSDSDNAPTSVSKNGYNLYKINTAQELAYV
ncbi:MAG: hypothetical protein IJW28_03055, partial [Clostridia bacterium]|nr:hypothetical protein [Clostridia bacterium]